jgi:hypothetical protein
MAVLSDGLQWVLSANTAKLDTAIDKSKVKVKQLDAETKKAGDGMTKSFFKTKEAAEKTRGAFLFYGTAIAALVTPALNTQSALSKLATAMRLQGQDTSKVTAQTKAAATALGMTYGAAATKAAGLVTQYGATVTGAFKAIEVGEQAQRLGLGKSEDAYEALASVAKATNVDLETLAETLGPQMNAAAAMTGTAIASYADALKSLAADAGRAKISNETLHQALVVLEQKGLSLAQAHQMLATFIRAGIAPTKEQTAEWIRMGGSAETLSNVGERSLIPFLEMATQSAVALGQATTPLLGDTIALNNAFEKGAAKHAAVTMAELASQTQVQNALLKEQLSAWDTISKAVSILSNIVSDALTTAFDKVNNLAKSIAGWLYEAAKAAGIAVGNLAADAASGLGVMGFASGGWVPGQGSGDKIPAMLEPGEFVIKKSVAKSHAQLLQAMNSGASTHTIMMLRQAYEAAVARRSARLGATPWSGAQTPFSFGQGPSGSPWKPMNGAFGQGFGMNSMASFKPANKPFVFGAGSPWGSFSSGNFAAKPTFAKSAGFATPSWAKFKEGGWVKQQAGVVRMAAGGMVKAASGGGIAQAGPVGSSHSYSIGSVNLTVSGAAPTPTVIRDRWLPALQREVAGGRSRRERTRR